MSDSKQDSQQVPGVGQLVDALGQDSEFLRRFSVTTRELAQELGVGLEASLDVLFLGYLRAMARFGVFSFGPVTIYVPLIEEIVARTAPGAEVGSQERIEGFVAFSRALNAEQRRTGRKRVDELQVLLAFMRVDQGLPARVFGELGVRPEDVEAYARGAGTRGDELEKLYSPEDAAEYLGIHVQTVRAWIRSGRLKASRLAGQRALRIRASDLEGVLEPLAPGDVE